MKKPKVKERKLTYSVAEFNGWRYCPETDNPATALEYKRTLQKRSHVSAYVVEIERRTWSNGIRDESWRIVYPSELNIIIKLHG